MSFVSIQHQYFPFWLKTHGQKLVNLPAMVNTLQPLQQLDEKIVPSQDEDGLLYELNTYTLKE